MTELERNNSARNAILASIREHLAASREHDAIHNEGSALIEARSVVSSSNGAPLSLVALFKQKLEAVGGHCFVAETDQEITAQLAKIISGLIDKSLPARRIVRSDAPMLDRLLKQTDIDVDPISACSNSEMFGYDIGLTTAQAAIAETGTLVLESESERHRLVSLVPPVHIAIIDAANICLTLGEALETVRRAGPAGMSPTVTLITGPSRTADIELTLAIGVHGPQELYVIVRNGAAIS